MELKIEHLSKQFKDKTAVNDVNLQKRAGLSTAVRMAPFILTRSEEHTSELQSH